MDLDGFGIPGPGSFGPLGAKALPALIALDEALLLLGLPSAATPNDVRSAQRAALGALQAQFQAGTLDRSTFRAQVERLDVAVRSALVGTRASAPAASGPANAAPATAGSATAPAPAGTVNSGSVPTAGAGVPISTPTLTPSQPSSPAPSAAGAGSIAAAPSGSAPPAVPGEAASPTGAAPVRTGPGSGPSPANPIPPGTNASGPAPTGPATAGPAFAATADAVGPDHRVDVLLPGAADSLPRTPRSDAAATMTALASLPLLNQTPPTRPQHELWTAVLVPAAAAHVETATALAATVARTEPQVAAAVMHVALTLALDDLSPEERRALLPLAAGVYEQLQAMLPRAVLAGLPPRDLLGGLPLQLWAPGPEVRFTALMIAVALVAFAVWAGLR